MCRITFIQKLKLFSHISTQRNSVCACACVHCLLVCSVLLHRRRICDKQSFAQLEFSSLWFSLTSIRIVYHSVFHRSLDSSLFENRKKSIVKLFDYKSNNVQLSKWIIQFLFVLSGGNFVLIYSWTKVNVEKQQIKYRNKFIVNFAID